MTRADEIRAVPELDVASADGQLAARDLSTGATRAALHLEAIEGDGPVFEHRQSERPAQKAEVPRERFG